MHLVLNLDCKGIVPLLAKVAVQSIECIANHIGYEGKKLIS